MISGFSPDSGVAGDGITNSHVVSLTGSAEANATVNVYDGGTRIGTATANAGGQWTLATGTLADATHPDATHSFTATATDVAGRTGGASNTLAVTFDTAAPVVAITSITDGTGSSFTDLITKDGVVTLSGSVSDAHGITKVEVFEGTTSLGTTTVNIGNWTLTTTLAGSGSHTLGVVATDVAGNISGTVSTPAITVDTTPPALAITSVTDDTGRSFTDRITKDGLVTLSGTVSDAHGIAKVEVFDGTTSLGTATVNNNGTWSLSATLASEGSHTLGVVATDIAGNASDTVHTALITVDKTPPAAPIITSAADNADPFIGNVANGGATNDTTPTLGGTAEANSSVTIYEGTTALGTVMADGGGAWSFTTAGLAQGSHSFTAKATDAAGNQGLASSSYTVTVDTTAPTVSEGLFSAPARWR